MNMTYRIRRIARALEQQDGVVTQDEVDQWVTELREVARHIERSVTRLDRSLYRMGRALDSPPAIP